MNLATIFLQTPPTDGQAPEANYSSLIMIVLLFVILYFFMIRPQQKQRKEIEKQRAALAVGDKVVTAGGVHGKLKDSKEATYVVEVADGVKITIDKTSIFAAPNAEDRK